jgi:hypothetical protein
MLRRWLVVVAVVIGTLVATAPAALAEKSDALNRRVSGPFSGTTAFDFDSLGCSFVHQVFDLTYDTARGPGSLHLEGCATPDNAWAGGFRYDLDFVLRLPKRGWLSGTATGGVFPMDLTLTVEHGSKRFRHVTGTIDLDGTWSATISTFEGTATGTLTGHLFRAHPHH